MVHAMLTLMFVFDWSMGAACLLAAVVSIAEPTSHCASFFHSPMTASPVPLLSETAAHGTL